MSGRLVVDANQLYSALLRDGRTRHQMMTTPATLFAPLFLRTEIERRKPGIVQRSGGTQQEIDQVLSVLYRRIAWVSDETIRPHLPKAKKLLGTVDPKDVPYLACAFAVDADAIWSRDEDFDEQDVVRRVPEP